MTFEVLVDGHSKKGGKLTGRTRGNKAVNFSGLDSLIGKLVLVRITDAGDNSLSGELCA
jgi:tRNA-2-methylthio-N6-dimethylallyladenosine synthase